MKKIFKEISPAFSVITYLDLITSHNKNTYRPKYLLNYNHGVIIKDRWHLCRHPFFTHAICKAIKMVESDGAHLTGNIFIETDNHYRVYCEKLNDDGFESSIASTSIGSIFIKINTMLIRVHINELKSLVKYLENNANMVREASDKIAHEIELSCIPELRKVTMTDSETYLDFSDIKSENSEIFFDIKRDESDLMANLFSTYIRNNRYDPFTINVEATDNKFIFTTYSFTKNRPSNIEKIALNDLQIDPDSLNEVEYENMLKFIEENNAILPTYHEVIKDTPIEILHRLIKNVKFKLYKFDPKIADDLYNEVINNIIDYKEIP